MAFIKTVLRFAIIVTISLTLTTPVVGQVEGLGTLEFANSGAEEAQEAFIRGVLLLHSFEYADAQTSFREAQRIDPDFGLAWWGDAMCHNHPLWRSQDLEGARTVLAGFAPTTEERLAKMKTDRERGYLQAVEILFGEGDKLSRDLAYSAAMRRLYQRFPDDLEAASFYALSILGTAQGERDFATYMRAGAIVEEVFDANPRHPGAAHYLIHSYDDAIHAPLGLRAARIYAEIAPAAAHAQHMISHIYTALGRWHEASLADQKSFAVSEARSRRLGQPRGNHHALMWLSYSLLQQGRWNEARAKLTMIDEDTSLHSTASNRWHQVYMRAAYAVETRRWDAVEVDVDTSDLSLSAVAAQLYVSGVQALERNQRQLARAILTKLQEQMTRAQPQGQDFYTTTSPTDHLVAKAVEQQFEGLIALAEGDQEEAIMALQKAAEIEASMKLTFGPPLVVKPSHELLGEVLLDLDRPVRAREAFEQALARAPRRAAALEGLELARRESGDTEGARQTADELARVRSGSDDSKLSSGLWGRLQPGPYSVGFKVFHSRDLSRPARTEGKETGQPTAQERGRHLQIGVWYPAKRPSGASPLRYEDYVRLELTEAGPEDSSPEASVDLVDRFLNYAYLSQQADKSAVRRLLRSATTAFRDAPAASGAFPWVLVAQANIGPTYRHSILSEYLASHGYIVATSPGVAKLPRSSNDSAISEQLLDLRYVINFLHDFPSLAPERLALVASSYGGGAVGELMMSNADVDAVISLDSFLSMGFGLEEARFEASPNYEAARARSTPILNLYQEQEGIVRHDLGFLDSFERADRYHFEMHEMQHFNLTSIGMFASKLPDLVGNPKLLIGGPPAALGHELMCRYVLHFLAATLLDDETSQVFLDKEPRHHGIPPGFLTWQLRKAQQPD